MPLINERWSIPLDIVTPTLNAARYLYDCLHSTKPLRRLSAIHVVVDSGSIDDTVKIVRSNQTSLLYYPPGNMYAAINVGIAKGISEWVTYINGDDIIYANEIIKALENVPHDCDVIYGNVDYIDTEGRFLHHWRSAQSHSFPGLFANTIMPFPQQGVLFRRSLWENLGGFEEEYKYSADFDFFLRAFVKGAKFHYHDAMPVAAFRLHGDQISQNFVNSMLSEGRDSFEKTALAVNRYKIIKAVAGMRFRNINSYLVRLLRYQHLYRKFKIIRSSSSAT